LAGPTIQLGFGSPGNSGSDYSIAPATMGVAQSVPEPFAMSFVLAAAALAAHRPRVNRFGSTPAAPRHACYDLG